MRRLAIALLVAGCGASETPGTQVRFDFSRPDFFAAPFPADDLRGADGHVSLAGFPNPDSIGLVTQATALIERDARGFALAGAVFFSFSAPLDPAALPSLATTITPDSAVQLLAIDRASPAFLKRHPTDVHFLADGGPFGGPNLLALLPLQGVPLRPHTRYAAVVRRSLKDASGKALGVPLALAQLLDDERPEKLPAALFAELREAVAALKEAGIQADSIAALTVFTTDDPAAAFDPFVTDVRQRGLTPPATFEAKETFADFCVFEGVAKIPVYQRGVAPFATEGGDLATDDAGRPSVQRIEESRVVVTLPRRAMPAGGFPTVVFIRTGGGGDRPMVDRGRRAVPGGPAVDPGTGPALEFAREGFAGVSIDGPLGGRRNPTGADEQFLVFNFNNGAALRDNVRQSALEIAALPPLLATLAIDASSCAGLSAPDSRARFDPSKLALMGHSMGASIAPLALAAVPEYRAAVLSGAGASWIANVAYKQKPLEVRPVAEALLRYPAGALTTHDPVLTLVQWATEPADAQVFAPRIIREPLAGQSPRHVLMLQGIVDHYILPEIANALSLSLGLDAAGPALDLDVGIAQQRPFDLVAPFAEVTRLALPAKANRGVTAIVVQHPSDGLEDGHEVAFQTDAPKREYRCFLRTFAAGTPLVPDASGACDLP